MFFVVGVANGSLFTYFETKTDLFNQLYLELKAEMAAAALKDLRPHTEPREQLSHIRLQDHRTYRKNKQLLDLSHGGQRTIAEAIAAAKRPPTISHTGCRSLHDNPRNVWDAELKALAEKGGVVGIYWMPFLTPDGKPTAADLVRHMSHAVDVCGEDHVAIGTDGRLSKTVIDEKARKAQKEFFERRAALGIAAPGEGPDVFNVVAELNSHLRFRMLSDALDKSGWPEPRIDKVLGGNLFRLYEEVWGG